jgi:hypothetical protein
MVIEPAFWRSSTSAVQRAALISIFVCGVPAVAAHADPLRPVVQARRQTSQNPACALLTVAEVRSVSGFSGYGEPSPGDPPGQGAGGGASCQYSAPDFPGVDARGNALPRQKGPLLSVVLIDGKDYTRTAPIAKGCKKEAVAGVGDEAYFEVCPTSRLSRTSPLYVKAGTKDLIVQMDIEAPDTEASLRPKVIALAKAAVAKLR